VATAANPVLATIHIVGPAEKEFRQSRSGVAHPIVVQRCLRCDELVTEGTVRFPVGARIALAPAGGRVKRYVLGGRELRDGEESCTATPFVDL
jgi:hypothetical protein